MKRHYPRLGGGSDPFGEVMVVVWMRMLHRGVCPVVLLCMAFLLAGTSSYADEREAEKVGEREDVAMTRAQLRHEIMRFASDAAWKVGGAYFALESESQTPKARHALALALGFGRSALEVAIAPDPEVNLLDMVVMVTLMRMVAETYWVPQVFGDRGQGVLKALRRSEVKIWSIASEVLTLEEQQELRDAIQEWRKRNPDQIYVEYVRFGDFADFLGESAIEKAQQSGGFFGISEATRSVDEALVLAERALFYLQRVPGIARFSAKLVVYDLIEQPQIKQLLSDTNTLAHTMDQTTKLMEELPKQIAQERAATIDHLMDRVAAEREAILPRVIKVVSHSEDEGEDLVDYGFRRGVALIVIFLIGSVLAMLAYRFTSEKLLRLGQGKRSS